MSNSIEAASLRSTNGSLRPEVFRDGMSDKGHLEREEAPDQRKWPHFGVKGSTVLLTGGSSGIGSIKQLMRPSLDADTALD